MRTAVAAGAGRLAYVAFLGLATLDAAGFGVIAPVIPAISEATDAGPAVMGLLVATYGIGTAAGFYLAGLGVERRGTGFVLAISVALMGLGAVGFVIVESLPLYFVARLLMGLGSGGLWIGISLGVIERWPGEEYRRLGGIVAVYSVGGIAGPALGAIGGIRGPFLAYLGLVCLGGLALRVLGAPHDHVRFESDRAVLRTRGFFFSSAGVLMVAITIGIFDGVLPLHFAELMSQPEIAALFVGASIVLAVSAVAAGRLPPRPTLLAATACIVGGIALAGAGDTVWVWVVALAVAAIGFGLTETSSLGILLEAVGTQRMVLAMVVWSQVFALGLLLGPAVGGLVAEVLGFGAIGLVPLFCATLVVAGAIRMPRPVAST
jgi:MFS family permease